MTNAQKWIAIFLELFIILLILTYATEPAGDDEDAYATEIETVSGEKIYADLQCANCHGENLQGTEQAPALLKLAENWTKTELINYLRNPEEFGNTERITELHKKYSNSIMPSFNNVDTKKLGKLAEFLLEK